MLHTHYDNLKVARQAPQEVIRAAYKALSQKYHPDKNPGNAKAARVMALINSAYGTLADPQRRREHDEWIAAEEWDIAWQARQQAQCSAQRPEPEHAPPAKAGRRGWLLLSAGIGAGVGVCIGLYIGLGWPSAAGAPAALHQVRDGGRDGCRWGCITPAVQR